MLAIRMQRTGRKGHAQFRIIVQEARRTPTSGAIVFKLGHYNPHAKEVVLDKEKTSFYLTHGAQPSDSVARLLKREGVKLPTWVKLATDKARPIKNTEKLRKNRPAEPKAAAPSEPEAPTEPAAEAEVAVESQSPEPETETTEEPVAEASDASAEEVIETEVAAEEASEPEAAASEPASETAETTEKTAA